MMKKLIKFICGLFGKKDDQSVAAPAPLMEAPSHQSLESMTKRELDALGTHHGLKLDRRRTKGSLIKTLNKAGIVHK